MFASFLIPSFVYMFLRCVSVCVCVCVCVCVHFLAYSFGSFDRNRRFPDPG